MNINWITIKVRSFEQSKEFYGSYLRLTEEREFSPKPGMRIVFFSAENGMKLELISDENEPLHTADGGNTVSIGVSGQNYEELLAEDRKKGILTSEPTILGKDMLCFFVSDPNGVGIQIVREQ